MPNWEPECPEGCDCPDCAPGMFRRRTPEEQARERDQAILNAAIDNLMRQRIPNWDRLDRMCQYKVRNVLWPNLDYLVKELGAPQVGVICSALLRTPMP